MDAQVISSFVRLRRMSDSAPKPYSGGLKRVQAEVGSPREFLAGASAIGAMVALDPAALVAAAVRGACLAKAPRRTVQAVAAAVVSVLVRPAEARLGSTRGETAKEQDAHEEVRAKSEEERREAIRAKRRARRPNERLRLQLPILRCGSPRWKVT